VLIQVIRTDESAQQSADNTTNQLTNGSVVTGEHYIASATTYELGDNTEADDIVFLTGYFDLTPVQANWRSMIAGGAVPGMQMYDATAGITADDAIDLHANMPDLYVKQGVQDSIFGIVRTKLSDYAGGGTTPTSDNSTWGTAGSLATGEYIVVDEDTIELGDTLEAEDVLFIHGWWNWKNLYPDYRKRISKTRQPLTQVLRGGVVAGDAAFNLTATQNAYFDMSQGTQNVITNIAWYDASGDTMTRQNTYDTTPTASGQHFVVDYNTFEMGDASDTHDLTFVTAFVDKWQLAY
jgi:hypothetical protein